MLKIEEAFERGTVYCLVRKCDRHAKFRYSERAEKMIWPSEYRSMADAWELSGEEGRDKLRKAGVRSTYPFTPGCPNGVIRCIHASPEYLNI